MNKLWLRITLSFLLLMSFLLIIAGFFIANVMEKTYYDLKEQQLKETASLMLKATEADVSITSADLQNKIKTLSVAVSERITVIDVAGKVLADSHENPAHMENHADRPEVEQIVKLQQSSGLSVRYSSTFGFSMMYVSVPIIADGEMIGVMRTALSLGEIEQAVKNLWTSLAVVLLTIFLLTGLIGMRLAKGISGPIEEMIQVSEKLKEKDYSARVKSAATGELGQLTNAINVLAASLKSQMDKIQENEQQLSGVLSNMMSGVLLVNTDGRIQLANKAMGKMIGELPGHFIGKHHMEVGRNVELSKLIDQCLKTCSELREEVHFYYPKERILDAHLAPYVGDNGNLKGMIAVLHDVTNIRRLERMRSEFVANVSHELKTPITSVKGFAETLLDGAMEDGVLCRSFLTIIQEESNRMHRLIQDLLYLSSIEHHRIPLQIDSVNLTEAVLRIADTLMDEAKKKKVKINLPQKKDVWIEGEKDRLHQVILNLLSNAINYTSEGGEVCALIIEEEEVVKLKISDTGIGIAQKELPRIFERFYRVDKARSRSSGGTGLGLAIVKHLVDSHHGTISVESREGEGTTFIVSLPTKQE